MVQVKRYNSRAGLEIVLPVSILLFGGLIMSSARQNWTGVIIIFLTACFILHVFLNTYYEIDGTQLRIKCGFLIDRQIDVMQIRSVKETFNPLSAPATSLDRLELRLGGKDSVLVSPKEKQLFINHLLMLNTGISVHLRAGKAVK